MTTVPARTTAHLPTDDIATSLKTSRELGPDYDDAVAASLAEHLEAAIDARVRAEVAHQLTQIKTTAHPTQRRRVDGSVLRLVMGILCLVAAIPVTIVGGYVADGAGVLVAFAGIIGFYLVTVWGADR
ncbi:hypothetical protein [Allonocardiopsis opalescens]|uniref:DUF3040 family protein n=1 Tax=Allonocardiopsis opalescens TaxID=1144618 RepID=A0A2T0Q4P7_9ACTN|nr:hypothetical protein [Allonocardiopsis opalescens]PRX98774.1 hypothetical protein CLV72_104354 [Allonocardiopsis opalescens]